jgi:quercetin dioxygenase-like cupin family protein
MSTAKSANTMKIFKPVDGQTKQAPASWFVGTVYMDELVAEPEKPARLRVNRVTFTPGGRTNWHTHPISQVLHVVSGVGRLQEEGGPLRELRPGDTAVIGAGIKHWHGSAPGKIFTHLALTDADETGSTATWLEPVSDADYSAKPTG